MLARKVLFRRALRTLSEAEPFFAAAGGAAALAGAADAAEEAPATVTPSAFPGKLRRRKRSVSRSAAASSISVL